MSDTREQLTVYIVDDDNAVRDALALSLSLRGYRTAMFASAEDFLAAFDPVAAGCIIADIRMPGMSGLELQAELAKRGSRIPVAILTAHGDVSSARTAFRSSAVDFLEKPYDDEQLVRAIETAFEREIARLDHQHRQSRDESKLALLSPREREVMNCLAQGLRAKEVGEQLGISSRTVEVHKTHIMEKLGARNLAEIVRLATVNSQ